MTRTAWIGGLALVATAMFGSTNEVSAQVTLGARVGYTQADMIFDPEAETSRLSSVAGGAFLRFGLGSVSFQPEVLVVTKGFLETVGPADLQLKTDYLEVPVLLRLSTGAGSPFAPYLLVGPSLGYEIRCQIEEEVAGQQVTDDCNDDDPNHKKFDVGVTGGLGFEFAIGAGSLLIEGRYVHGLTDLNDGDSISERNRAFGAFLGYAIPLGGVR
jgi:outer membrane protein with beta-barrel domain